MTNKVLLDTNILIYLSYENSPFYISHPEKMLGDKDVYIADKSLLEFYRVFTGSLKQSVDFTLAVINFFTTSNQFTILNSSDATHYLTFELAEEFQVTSGKIFDVNILATAIEHDIPLLYTKNVKDYPQTGTVQIIDPLMLI